MATNRLSAEQKKNADNVLTRLDKLAGDIQANYQGWGMSLDAAKNVVNHLDKVADTFEEQVYGPKALLKRQAALMAKDAAAGPEVKKIAEVLQSDKDEPYMQSFVVDQGIVQAESDEPYMQAYADDQSSAVHHGVSSTGVPLAPKH